MAGSAAREILARCRALARFSETNEGITRTFLCEAMHDCHRYLGAEMQSLGMEVAVDAAGNLRGFYPGSRRDSKRLIAGSHLDTVPNAGAYDGVLGVVLAIALVEALDGQKLPFGIEVVGFSEEEGVRFSTPFIGSRALVGRVDSNLLRRVDPSNITLEQAIRNFGLDPSRIPDAALADDAFAYLEFHIEQGPVLDSLDKPLAVVEAIAGQTRATLSFRGKANHAGTTPRHLRRDALAGAAEWIGIVEREDVLATVGHIQAKPGAANVIAGEVNATLDVRDASDELRTAALVRLLVDAKDVAGRRGLLVDHCVLSNQPAVKMDTALVNLADRAIATTGAHPHRMVSGAGHDAMIVAEKIPAVMIFLRSPGGISHHPDETVQPGDVELAVRAGLHFLEELAACTT